MIRRLLASFALCVALTGGATAALTPDVGAAVTPRIANISNAWKNFNIGFCGLRARQPFTNTVKVQTTNGKCQRFRLEGFVFGNQFVQCSANTGAYKPGGLAVGTERTCQIWFVVHGATNADICFVYVYATDTDGYVNDKIYIRGGGLA